ncbi:MAG TPA: hypothetical protein VEF76_04650 [Patescibacteria group bacterium]|nr:hypothetical protein [Patescibacteria group bacterium]
MPKKTESLEVSSDQIHTDLVEIKERLAALETISSLANRSTVEGWVRECLNTDNLKKIVAACEHPKTKDELRAELGLTTTQALDHHLKTVRSYDLLQQETNEAGKMTFRWSNLFARLPKRTRDVLLASSKPNTKNQ